MYVCLMSCTVTLGSSGKVEHVTCTWVNFARGDGVTLVFAIHVEQVASCTAQVALAVQAWSSDYYKSSP